MVQSGTVWAMPYKTKHGITIQGGTHDPWHLPNELTICAHKNLHVVFRASLLITAKPGSDQNYLQKVIE